MKLLLAVWLVTGPFTAQAQSTAAPLLRTIDSKGIETLLSSSKGRILVLNFWATWCKPCVEEFPRLVQLQKTYGRDVDVVFVSIDDDDAKTLRKVKAFLGRMNVTSDAYIKTGGGDEQFINTVDPRWSGALPATFVYARNGTLAAMKVEELSAAELESIVRPLLGR